MFSFFIIFSHHHLSSIYPLLPLPPHTLPTSHHTPPCPWALSLYEGWGGKGVICFHSYPFKIWQDKRNELCWDVFILQGTWGLGPPLSPGSQPSEALLLPLAPPLLPLREGSHLKGLAEAPKEGVGAHRHGVGSAVILGFKFHGKSQIFFFFFTLILDNYWVWTKVIQESINVFVILLFFSEIQKAKQMMTPGKYSSWQKMYWFRD